MEIDNFFSLVPPASVTKEPRKNKVQFLCIFYDAEVSQGIMFMLQNGAILKA